VSLAGALPLAIFAGLIALFSGKRDSKKNKEDKTKKSH